MIYSTAAVPILWSIQIAEWARDAEVQGRGTQAKIETFLDGLCQFRIHVDRSTPFRAWGDLLSVARTHNVSIYVAAYLELALRLKLPLATTDATWVNAAHSAGAPILTP